MQQETEAVIFRFLRRSLVVVALAALSAGVSGCLALAIPSLAYQGYKYEHPDKTTSRQKSTSQKKSASSTKQTPQQYQIE